MLILTFQINVVRRLYGARHGSVATVVKLLLKRDGINADPKNE